MEPQTQQAQAKATDAYTLAQSADARARDTEVQAQVARDLALGNIKREEVRRVTVTFPFNSAVGSEEHQMSLDGVIQDMRMNPNFMALVSGHTDATGDPNYNLGLADRRASAVQLYLAQQLGADFVRVATIGLGELQPVADNETSEGRAQNRRTEVILVRPAPATAADRTIPTASR